MPNMCSKFQIAKNGMVLSEEPTINNFFNIDSRHFWICPSKCRSTEANRSISYQPKYVFKEPYYTCTLFIDDIMVQECKDINFKTLALYFILFKMPLFFSIQSNFWVILHTNRQTERKSHRQTYSNRHATSPYLIYFLILFWEKNYQRIIPVYWNVQSYQ